MLGVGGGGNMQASRRKCLFTNTGKQLMVTKSYCVIVHKMYYVAMVSKYLSCINQNVYVF